MFPSQVGAVSELIVPPLNDNVIDSSLSFFPVIETSFSVFAAAIASKASTSASELPYLLASCSCWSAVKLAINSSKLGYSSYNASNSSAFNDIT